jgi:Methyltransferase domain
MASGAELARLTLRHPVEAAYRLAGTFEDRRVEAESREAEGLYEPADDWLEQLHDRLGVVNCDEEDPFGDAWSELESLAGELHVESHDSDRAFARALWCVVRHTRAKRVVETGVARGVSARILLEAVDPRGGGGLWSVDLPLLSDEWVGLFGTAITADLREHWTYVRGPSKRVLPRLLRRLGQIDVFVQDSRGTTGTAGFEFGAAWRALRPGGVLIANSVERSPAFSRFAEEVAPSLSVVAAFDRKPGVFGVAVKAGPGTGPQDAGSQRTSRE